MYEVEVKVAAEHDAVRDRLPADAEALGTVEQVDTYFDAPHRDFAATDEALRLRRERPVEDDAPGDGNDPADTGWTTAITYKGPLVEEASKTREEFETVVSDGGELEATLDRLGFEPAAEVRKRRERYRIEAFTVSLDVVEGLGEFLEIETEVEPGGSDDATAEAEAIAGPRDEALSLIAEFGCDPDEQIRTSYLGLLLAEE